MSSRYTRVYVPGHPHADAKGAVDEHVYLMTVRLGRPLTKSECVHHIDNNSKNNELSNLQLFSTQAEHLRHHAEERAFQACGERSFMKCQYCKTYDNPLNMSVRKVGYSAKHKKCHAEYMTAYNAKKANDAH